MHPFALLIIAILTPFVMSLALFAPPYAGLAAASYIIYNTGETNPLTAHLADVFYMVDVYTKLLSYWQANHDKVSLVNYTLPLIGLPLSGLLCGLWFTRNLVRRLSDVFHMSASA